MKILNLLIGSFLLLSSSCSCSCDREKCGLNGGAYYMFELEAELLPRQDTFQVGDTITVISQFDDVVFERYTQSSYKLEDFPFYPRTGLTELDTVPQFPSIRNFGFVLPSVYRFYTFYRDDGTSSMAATYVYEGGEYKLEYKFIPRKPGLYLFNLGSQLQPLNGDQDFPGRCRGIESWAYVKLNGGADNNIQMLQYSADTAQANWILKEPQDRFHDWGGYVFYVKE